MDPGPNQSPSSTPLPLPPPSAGAKDIELQVLPAASAVTAEPRPGNADPDRPVSLGVKLTTYRLLNLVTILAFGLAKLILSLKGQSAAPTDLEWVAGSVFAALSYWIGLYEPVEPPRWEWLLHVDLAPAIGFMMKCFLGGVLRSFASHWETNPFWLFICIPLLVIVRITVPPTKQSIIYIVYTCTEATALLPEKWRVWKRMRVWDLVWRFFWKYGLDWPTLGRYRLWGRAMFILGIFSGRVLLQLIQIVVAFGWVIRLLNDCWCTNDYPHFYFYYTTHLNKIEQGSKLSG